MVLTTVANHQLGDILKRVCERLQLSESRHQDAVQRYQAVGAWLADQGSSLAIYAPQIYPQGSLRIGTTVQPLKYTEYDIDLVCELKVDFKQCHPLDLLNAVEARLKEHATYRTMIARKKRCIRLNYADEFHMDILPACPDYTQSGTCIVVPDRKANGNQGGWKPSNPKGFATWFEERASQMIAQRFKAIEPVPDNQPLYRKSPLQQAVQLMKRWRDLQFSDHPNEAPASIVLTTLAANFYRPASFVTDALSQILDEIVFATRTTTGPLAVCNPTNPMEVLSERWCEVNGSYELFVEKICEFHEDWMALGDQLGLTEISLALEHLFGEAVVRQAFKDHAESLERARQSGLLRFQPATGILATPTFQQAIPVRRNTFHGE